MKIVEIHFHHVITTTHNCVVVATAAATSVRTSHPPSLGAAVVGMICLVFVFWLTGCLFVCAFAYVCLVWTGCK